MIENLINGNEINLDDLMKVAKNISEQANPELAILNEIQENASNELNEDKMETFTRIVKGVAKKYSIENFGVEREDLEQDLWIKVLELINSCGGIENTDPRLVAKSCWNTAVDKYRYHRRRRDSKAEYLEGTEDDSDLAITSNNIQNSKCRNCMDEILIQEAIDLFPKGSRERKYVVTKLYMYGEIDPSTYIGDDELELPEDDSEAAVLKLLGYKSKYPASWGAMKHKMRYEIYRYLGIIDDSKKDSKKKSDEESSDEDRLELISKRVEQRFRDSACDYIFVNNLKKDKVLKMYGASQEEIIASVADSKSLVTGLNKDGNSIFIMKRKESCMNEGRKNGDKFFNE